MRASTAASGTDDCAGLIQLLKIPQQHRKSEDVFEIANSLYRASFVRQLDFVTRSGIARCAEAYEIVPGSHIHLSREGNNALYIILSGSVKAEAAGLEFSAGDTFGFRTLTSPSLQLILDSPVVTCAGRGLAAVVPFEYCSKLWPDTGGSHWDSSEQDQAARIAEAMPSLVWSPELAKSILLKGGAEGEGVLVASEFLNFPPITGYSTEVREILVSQFQMRREEQGGVFLEWINAIPIDPNDVQLSRVDCDQVVIVVSGCLKATCRRRTKAQLGQSSALAGSQLVSEGTFAGGGGENDKSGGGNVKPDSENPENVSPKPETSTRDSFNGDGTSKTNGGDSDERENHGEFTLVHLKPGGVFPPQSGLMILGRSRKDKEDFDQDVGEEWADFDLCSLVGDSPTSTTEVLLVDAHLFHDIIYPGVDLCYSMEPVRTILHKAPGMRTLKEISYIARNVLSHHVAFQQMSHMSLERIASRLTRICVVAGGETLVEHGKRVTEFLILLRGSARIMGFSKAMKARSAARRIKVGRLEPGDMWGMQHARGAMEAGFEIVTVEGCEVIRGDMAMVRAAEKQAEVDPTVGARAMRSLVVPPERRSRRDVRNIADELSVSRSGLDIARLRHVPACLKTRIAAVLRLEVLPAFLELRRDEKNAKTYLFIIKGSLSLQAVTKSNRFTVENLDMPATGQLKALDVDNGLALEDWRASGLGPCVGMKFERQVLGEYPNSEENVLSVRAVTRQETTAAVVDSDLYAENLLRMDYSDTHSAVCREVLAQLKRCRAEDAPGAAGLEADIVCRLLKENPVLKRIGISCFPRMAGSITLKRYGAGEVVTEAEEYDDSLHIILEGLLEYAVQETHRGVIDRSLAKEVGIAPGLRCVGVMTAGDFFAPESMLGKRRGRKPRVVAAGSYRIRCSPQAQARGTGSGGAGDRDGGGGAICLILPRKKVESAVHRDHQVKRAMLHRTSTGPTAASTSDTGGASLSGGQQAERLALDRVSFGGPGEPKGGCFSGANGQDDEGKTDQIEGSNPVAGSAGPASAGAASPHSHAQVAAAITAEPPLGTESEAGEHQGKSQAFLTAVPAPIVQAAEGSGNPPVTPITISPTLAKLQDRGRGISMSSSSFSGAPLTPTRCCRGCCDDGVAGSAAQGGFVAGGVDDGGGGEERNGCASAEGISHTRCRAARVFSVGNSFAADDISRGFRGQPVDFASRSDEARTDAPSACCGSYGFGEDGESFGISSAAAGQKWADVSRCHGSRQAAAAVSVCASADSQEHEGWRRACFSSGGGSGGDGRSFCCCAASSSSDFGAGGIAVGNGDEERLCKDGWWPVGMIAARGNGFTKASDGSDGSDGLLNSLRHFVTSHVDLCEHKLNFERTTWVSPREDASGRLLTDEVELIGKLSDGVCREPSGGGGGGGHRKLAGDEAAECALRLTPLCCRQRLPPLMSGRSAGGGTRVNTGVRRSNAGEGDDGVLVAAPAPATAEASTKQEARHGRGPRSSSSPGDACFVACSGRKERTERPSPPRGRKGASAGAVLPVQPPTWSRPTPRASSRRTTLARGGRNSRRAERRGRRRRRRAATEEEGEDGEGDETEEDLRCLSDRHDQRGRPCCLRRTSRQSRRRARPMKCDRQKSPTTSDAGEEEKEEGGGRRSIGCENHRERHSRNSSSSSTTTTTTDSDSSSHTSNCSCCRQGRSEYEGHARSSKKQQQQQEEGVDIAQFEGFSGGVTSAAKDAIVPKNSIVVRARSQPLVNAATAGRNPENFYGNDNQSQRRPCTGAPSHGWRSLARPDGAHRTLFADGEHPRMSKMYASRVDPTVLSRLPIATGELVTSEGGHGSGQGGALLDSDGVDGRGERCDINEEAETQGTTIGFASRGSRTAGAVRSRKQPAVVRRLKSTLQALNDSF